MAAKKTAEQKKEFNMVQVFAMWKKKSKAGKPYFTGQGDGFFLTGFYNGKKQNPKEPDVRVYKMDADGNMEKEEYCSLWMNVSKGGKKYLSGKVDGKKVVGFINDTENTKRPYFSVYFSEGEPKKAVPATDDFVTVPEGSEEELPF